MTNFNQMKVRTRITFLFSLVTGTILLIFASITYYSAMESREREFYALLKQEAITKANLFFNAKVDAKTLQDIYKSSRQTLDEVEVAIHDRDFNLLYHDAIEIDYVKETPEMIDRIYQNGAIQFYQNDWQVIGLLYEYEQNSYALTATSKDNYGYSKLSALLRTLILLFIISILFIFVAGRFFSKKAFQPVRNMVEKAKRITATHLDLRLPANGNKDELSELAETFNEMLNRLENSLDAQKEFVSNISHELRTPLASMITELEWSLSKKRDVAEYNMAIENSLNDAQKLVRLTNSLLDLAKASYDPSEISFKPLRVDEVLLDARQQVQYANPGYKIDIRFENDIENEHEISVHGNEYLLKVGFANLFDNGCKFSEDKSCLVSVFVRHSPDSPHFNSSGQDIQLDKNASSYIVLKFIDQGIGIPKEDLDHIFMPFFRGRNEKSAGGNGIGLSLTKKIITLHKGHIDVTSAGGAGSTFTVVLQNI